MSNVENGIDAKPVAVIDKSVFQRICEQEASLREEIWRTLLTHFQIVIPLMLVEEVCVDVSNTNAKSNTVGRVMMDKLWEFSAYWMEDVHETAFRELVLHEQTLGFRNPNSKFIEQIEALKLGDPELLAEFVVKRKLIQKETVEIWKREQKRLVDPRKLPIVADAAEFFHRVVAPQFTKTIRDPANKLEFLEAILGKPFRERHPEDSGRIDEAFRHYGESILDEYPLTHACLVTRLCYVLAPMVEMRFPWSREPLKIIKSDYKGQRNSISDEHYIIAALRGHRLLTADAGMRNIMSVFERALIWKGRTNFVKAKRECPIETQIQSLTA